MNFTVADVKLAAVQLRLRPIVIRFCIDMFEDGVQFRDAKTAAEFVSRCWAAWTER
jgi:hypothetical protein